MDLHQLSKLTTAARIPPVLPGTNRWKSMHPSSDEKKQHFQNMAVSCAKAGRLSIITIFIRV